MRKPIIYFILASLALVLLWLGVHYLFTGRIVITTNNTANSINLFKLGSDGSQKPLQSNVPHILSARLGPGAYLIRVNSKSFITSRVVVVKARQTLNYSMNPVSLTALEPVSPVGATSIMATATSLLYIDIGSKLLTVIDAQNNQQTVIAAPQFLTIKWADASFGIGQTPSGNLYSISSGSAALLNLPFGTNDQVAVYYTVSTNRQIFVTHGPNVYTGTISEGFKKIYIAKSPSPALASWGDKVAVLEAPGDTSNKTTPPSITVLEKSGLILNKQPIEASFAAWSPDGRYLVITSQGAGGKIVTSSLATVASLPASLINDALWVDSTLYYTVGEQLWSYSVTDQTSQLRASMPANHILSDLSVSSDKSYIYLTVAPAGSNNSRQLYRLGLQGQTVASYVYQLPIILPDSSQICTLSYINFTSLTILGTNYGNPDTNQSCSSAANTVLGVYGINVALLGHHYTQVIAVD